MRRHCIRCHQRAVHALKFYHVDHPASISLMDTESLPALICLWMVALETPAILAAWEILSRAMYLPLYTSIGSEHR